MKELMIFNNSNFGEIKIMYNEIGDAYFNLEDVCKILDIKNIRDKIIEDEYTHVLFTSPSGKGLKLIVKIPKVKSDEDYKKY